MSRKRSLKPGTLLAPIPAVMVSCSLNGEDNIITIGWTGIACSEPPMTYISIKPERHSYNMVKESGEFVINLVSGDLVYEMDRCGCTSGEKTDKFSEMHLTKEAAEKLSCPMIAESPVNLECKVVRTIELGSHTMFLAEIVAMHVSEDIMDGNGRIALEKAGLIASCHGSYYELPEKASGRFGYSVMKPKTVKRRRKQGLPTGGTGPKYKKENK